MSKVKINDQILKEIKENSKDNKAIAEFLIDLLYEEAEHSSQWWWKETYKKKVKKYSREWIDGNEN